MSENKRETLREKFYRECTEEDFGQLEYPKITKQTADMWLLG